MLRIENLTKTYSSGFIPRRTTAVCNLNLEIEKGEVFAFLGANGAGKTTTIKAILNIISPTEGRIWIMGIDNRQKEARRKVGFLPDQPYFYDYLTAKEFLFFTARLYGMPKTEISEKIYSLLELVGLHEDAYLHLRKYSRGMLQRLAFAQALINDPELLILDEPMTGLDPLGRKQFRDIILNLKERKKTIFFSSHILSDAELIADRVGIINKGHLVNIGKLDDLLETQIQEVEITFQINNSQLPELKKQYPNLISRDSKVLIKVPSEQHTMEVIRELETRGGHLISVIPHKRNLEEIFVEEIKRS
ncbi:ABC transporter ATP-binding protein [candidate division KSB1 bacterium]|nr:MAG: ABC transporter ATP-binding protein [candidate division KSB1 bacterium]